MLHDETEGRGLTGPVTDRIPRMGETRLRCVRFDNAAGLLAAVAVFGRSRYGAR